MSYSYDDAGNLTSDAQFQYQYDAWNRLTGVWYADGNMSQATERVACYRYDGLSRRVWKQITNQGEGVIYHSDDDGVTGIQAGDRHEHYYYSGWRLVETTNHVNGLISGVYDYAVSYVLNQFVYGTQYIDEPVRYDRNLDTDDDCIDTDEGGSAAYFYQQDANYRVVMLTDEDGYVVERTTYTAYGEPTVHGGVDSGAAAELGNTLLVSSVGNPFMHQGLFRDRESLSYQNRFRQYDSRSGRFLQRDPLYLDHLTMHECASSNPLTIVDPNGLYPVCCVGNGAPSWTNCSNPPPDVCDYNATWQWRYNCCLGNGRLSWDFDNVCEKSCGKPPVGMLPPDKLDDRKKENEDEIAHNDERNREEAEIMEHDKHEFYHFFDYLGGGSPLQKGESGGRLGKSLQKLHTEGLREKENEGLRAENEEIDRLRQESSPESPTTQTVPG